MLDRLCHTLHVYWSHLTLTPKPHVPVLQMKKLKLREIMKRVQVHTAHKSFKNVCEERLAGSFSHCSLYSPPGNLVESQNKLSLPHQLLSLLTLMRRLKTKVFSLDLLTPGTVKHGREMIFFSLGGTKWKSSWWARAPEPFPYLTTRMMPDSYSVKRGAWRILLWKNLSTQEERPTNTDWWEFPNTKVRACLLDREAHTAAKLFHSQRLTC